MRTLVTLFTFLFTTTVYAQQAIRQVPVVCSHVLDFASTMEQFGEAPMIRGESIRMTEPNPTVNILVVFFNSQTRTWTIAEKVSQEVICVLAVGEKLEPFKQDGNVYETPNEFKGVTFRKELRKEGLIK